MYIYISILQSLMCVWLVAALQNAMLMTLIVLQFAWMPECWQWQIRNRLVWVYSMANCSYRRHSFWDPVHWQLLSSTIPHRSAFVPCNPNHAITKCNGLRGRWRRGSILYSGPAFSSHKNAEYARNLLENGRQLNVDLHNWKALTCSDCSKGN